MSSSDTQSLIHRVGGRRTIVDRFLDNVRDRAEQCFVRFAGRDHTYGAVGAQVERLAASLAAAGIGRGDRVALALGNRPAFVVAFLGVLRTGATAVPLNTLYKADEYRYALEHAGCAAALTEPVHEPRLVEAAAQMAKPPLRFVATAEEGVFAAAPGAAAAASAGSIAGNAAALPVLEDLAGVFYTSGTTARPKGVMITHANLIWSAEVTIQSLRLGPGDVPLLAFPLFHVNSLFYGLLSAVVMGGSIGLLEGFSVSRYWSDAIATGSTWTPGITGPLIRLLLRQDARPEDSAHRLRFAVGGTFLSLEELDAFTARFGVQLVPGWSMTETVGFGTLHPVGRGLPIRATTGMGFPTLGQEVRLVRDEGGDASPGEPGELLFRSPGIFAGYLNDPAATAAAFAEGGWFRTGDLACADATGYLCFVDRKKDMIKSKGENVAAAEVERVLNEHPGVAESAVIGVRVGEGLMGERVEAFVVRAAGNEVDEATLQAFARDRLADFKVPAAVHFIAALPKTPLGKIQRAELKRSRPVAGASGG